MSKRKETVLGRLETVLYWLFLALLVYIPLYLKFPLLGVTGTFVAIRFEDLLILIVYLIWFFILLLNGSLKKLLRSKIILTLLVFFFVGASAWFCGVFVSQTIKPGLGLFHLARRVELMLLMPLAAYVINSRRRFYVSLGVLSLVAFLANFYALGQRFFHFPAIATTNAELSKGVIYYLSSYDRVTSTFAGHYDLAVFLVIVLSIASSVLLYFLLKKGLDTKKRALHIGWLTLLAVVSFIVLIMTAARLSFIAALAGIIFSFLFTGNKKFIIIIIPLLLIGLAVPTQLRNRFISTFTVNIQKSLNSYFQGTQEQVQRNQLNIPTLSLPKFQEKENVPGASDIVPGEPVNINDLGVYRSFDIRTKVEWPRAIRSLRTNPLLGTGYSSLDLATDNDFLRLLGEVGILGTIAFMMVLYVVIETVWSRHRLSSGFIFYFSSGCLAMIAAFLINSLFIDVFEASKVASLFWLIIGITLGVSKKQIAEEC